MSSNSSFNEYTATVRNKPDQIHAWFQPFKQEGIRLHVVVPDDAKLVCRRCFVGNRSKYAFTFSSYAQKHGPKCQCIVNETTADEILVRHDNVTKSIPIPFDLAVYIYTTAITHRSRITGGLKEGNSSRNDQTVEELSAEKRVKTCCLDCAR
jgi:hypothetical protein